MPVTTTEVRDRVAIVTLDVPGEPVNTFGPGAAAELQAVLDELRSEAGVEAVVLRSGKPDSFVAGADINAFVAFTSAAEAEAASRQGHAFLDGVAGFAKPVVVAIHGTCLGLGLELALACRYWVASDHPKTQLGLPEVQLGIIPGAGGCSRLPRLIGLRAALDLILAGKSERAAKAFTLGLVDELVPESILLETAFRAAKRLAAGEAIRGRRRGGLAGALLDRSLPGRLLVYRMARRQVLAKTQGHYPAPLAAIEVVATSMERGMAAGLAAEAKAFGALAVSPVSRELVGIFFATNALKKDDGVPAGTAAREVSRLGVVGAGFMGAGIAGTAIGTAKAEVRLKDADLARVGKGIMAALAIPRAQLGRRRISKFEYERIAALVSGGTDYAGFSAADLVIEAVFEDLSVKRQVVAELESVVPSGTVIASNTSTIPIARIAEAARHPERVLGMHFFSPVDRMPLLEVIPAAPTDPEAIATAVRFGRRLGKTVIVVGDRPGFWVNRILAPYIVEAGHLLAEGVPIEVIDRAMVRFGFPVGPLALLDEVGLDVAAKGGGVMREAFGDRLASSPAVETLLAAKRFGRKTGSGFYLYRDGKKADPDPAVYRLIGVKPLAAVEPGGLAERLVSVLLNEAARAHAEGVIRCPRDGDIGAVFGIGFPPFRGGPLRMIDQEGADRIVARLEGLTARLGPRFAPAEALLEHARGGSRYYS
ncbi:MAG: fatty acid oxidation complex subunit alpha FadJ [Gemmatimonadetes bacterium]|nr:fatty acid oxidation complex subunit alpha FadJ [Gemmatimonadota bacterium]